MRAVFSVCLCLFSIGAAQPPMIPFTEANYHRCLPDIEHGPKIDVAPILLEYCTWSSQRVSSLLAGILLREVLGMPVQLVRYGTTNWTSLAGGYSHANLEVWSSHRLSYDKFVTQDGVVMDLGGIGEQSRPGLYFPKHMLSIDPMMETWYGIKNPENAKHFREDYTDPVTGVVTPANETAQGVVHLGPPGWGTSKLMTMLVNNLALPYRIVYHSSYSELEALLAARMAAQQPILFYKWIPHFLDTKYGSTLQRVQFRDHTPECWATLSAGGITCDAPSDTLYKVMNPAFALQNPPATVLFRQMRVVNEDFVEIWTRGGPTNTLASEYEGVCSFLRANKNKWKGWIVPVPVCGERDVGYRVSACDAATGVQTATFFWNFTSVCNKADATLPSPETRACDHVPAGSPAASTITVVALAGAGINALLSLAVLATRGTPVMRASQPVFCLIFTGGATAASASSLALVGAHSTAACTSRIWLFNLSLCVMFSGLLVKVYRVWRLFLNDKLQRRNVGVRTMLPLLAGVIGGNLLLLAAWAALGSLRAQSVEVTWVGGRVVSTEVVCVDSVPILPTLALLYQVVMVLCLCMLSFQARNVSEKYSESRWIMFSCYNLLLIASVIAFLYFGIAGLSPAEKAVLQAVGVTLASCVATLTLLVPKAFMTAQSGATSSGTYNIKVKPSATGQRSSRTGGGTQGEGKTAALAS